MAMRCVAFASFCFCVVAPFAVSTMPAQAGGAYYGARHYAGGVYGSPNGDYVWYSSSCCYRKIVRHERSVRYERVYGGGGYYGAGYYGGGYYDEPYYAPSRYYGRAYGYGYDRGPRRYVDYGRGYYSGSRGVCYRAGAYVTVCN
jgi:hypothetical protein